MSTNELYANPVDVTETWDVPLAGESRFTWEYDAGRHRLLSLYQKGKDKQWDQTTRIDWSLEVDPYDALGLPVEVLAIYGTPIWDKLSEDQKRELHRHHAAWQFSQFLHGEQGAMICAARIVESAPDLDAKFYAATQTMDEARHAETYARFLQEKVGLVYPINDNLAKLLDETLSDSRWDMPFLGMQVLIEGLALAAFGVLRDMTTKPLPKQILSYVMQDEARHVAFGRMALKDAYREMSTAEREEREEFVVEACYLMRDRIRGKEVWGTVGLDEDECDAYVDQSEVMIAFRNHLFTRIVPIVKDIGLWGPKVQRAYADMGVLEMGDANLDALMKQDEDVAEQLDRDRSEAREVEQRIAEIEQTIAVGADEQPVAVD
ncbi:MAG: ferritin-like domain-containing protein [Actinobacteria bacterium]|nr:ferritin-like domain-containing protein [Actinomycetota bacterium]